MISAWALSIHFQDDCVSRGHTAISQIFIFVSYINEWFRIFISIYSGWLCEQGPYSHPTDFIFISELVQTLVRIILCDCMCKNPTDFILITYMYISELFQTFDKYNSVRLCVQGPYSHPTDFILISYIHELFETFDKYNSVWLCVQGPHSHTTDFILITDISELHVCILKWNKQPLWWPNLSQTGIVVKGYPSKQISPKARLHQQQ